MQVGAVANQPQILFKIPPPTTPRLPSNIPLRTLPTRASYDNSNTLLLSTNQSYDHPPHRSSFGSESSWTDTGDIGEQLDDNDDPIRLQLPDAIEEELLARVSRRQRRQKKVRIHEPSPKRYDRSISRTRTIDKEAIQVPVVQPHRPSRAERFIGSIMAGSSGSIHGLTGKALM